MSSTIANYDYDVRKIVNAWKYPTDDLLSICAHRGASHDGGTENSYSSVSRAANEGWESIEIDLRLTKDNRVVVFHDEGLGRLTDVKPPPGQVQYNPFTGVGYNPRVKEVAWTGEMENLFLRNGYGTVTTEHPILLEDLLAFIRDNEINMVVQFDLKEREVVGPSFEIIWDFENAEGIPASEWCVFKLRTEWFPTPAEWENKDYVKKAIASGRRLPPVTPLYEVENGQTTETMAAWAGKDYFIAYEIALKRPNGTFQEAVNFVKSDRSKCKGHGGWFIGSDLPRGYYAGIPTVWDDSTVRAQILAEGPDVPCQLQEWVGARKPDGVFGIPSALPDERIRLSWSLTVGLNYVISDTHVDVHAQLDKVGKRNVSRMKK